MERTSIVIGDDGMNSLVARAVQAPEYNAKPPIAGPFFSYWSGVLMNGFEFYPAERRCVFNWMTNDGLALVGVASPLKEFQASRADLERNVLSTVNAIAPTLSARLQSGRRKRPS